MGHRLLLLSQVGTSRDRSGLASFSRSDVPDSDSRELQGWFPFSLVFCADRLSEQANRCTQTTVFYFPT